MTPLWLPIALGGAGTVAAVAAAAAWSVRGRSSAVWAPSIWRGEASRAAVALTFDDGPGESTPAVLELLALHSARATFFQIGANARRLPAVARQVSEAGHEIGNHSDTHPRLWLRGPAFIDGEVTRAQQTLTAIHGGAPRLFRAPYGVRWPGLGAAQRRHKLLGVMWTAIGRDWSAESPDSIAARLLAAATARPGAILCLHDGRELTARPDIESTLAVLRILLPALRSRGIAVETVSELRRA